MSILVKLIDIQINRKAEVVHEQPHSFVLQVFNRKFKESLKATIHPIEKAYFSLPQNLFTFPCEETLQFLLEETECGEQKKQKLLTCGESQINFKAIVKEKKKIEQQNENKMQEFGSDSLKFDTKDNNFEVQIRYKYKYIQNKIFAGHFHGCLQNQGEKMMSLINLNEYLSLNHRYSSRQEIDEGNVMKNVNRQESQISSQKPASGFFRSCLEDLTTNKNQSNIAQRQQFEKNPIQSKLIKKKSTHMINSQNETQIKSSPLTRITRFITFGSNSSPQQIRQQKKKHFQKYLTSYAQGNVQFYKGPCKSRNIFSCFDAKMDQQQVCIIEPHYK